jgi:hypothetical protein
LKECQEAIPQQHSTVSQNTRILKKTAAENLKSHMFTNFFDERQKNYKNLGGISSLQDET